MAGTHWGRSRAGSLAAGSWARPAAHLVRFARFVLVGLTGVLLNTGMLYLLVAGLRWNHLTAAAAATETAIISNFVLNDRWTFRDATARAVWLARLWRYNAVALGGLGISLAVLAILTVAAGVEYLLANLAGIAAATLWNYAANLRVTWSMARAAASAPRQTAETFGEAATYDETRDSGR